MQPGFFAHRIQRIIEQAEQHRADFGRYDSRRHVVLVGAAHQLHGKISVVFFNPVPVRGQLLVDKRIDVDLDKLSRFHLEQLVHAADYPREAGTVVAYFAGVALNQGQQRHQFVLHVGIGGIGGLAEQLLALGQELVRHFSKIIHVAQGVEQPVDEPFSKLADGGQLLLPDELLLSFAQVGQRLLEAFEQVVGLLFLHQQLAAAGFQLLAGGREVGDHFIEGGAQLPNLVARVAWHALREVAPAHFGGGVAQFQHGHGNVFRQHEANADANAENHEAEKQRGNPNLPLALHDFPGGGGQQYFAGHDRGAETGPLHDREVVGYRVHVHLCALGVGFEHRARDAVLGVAGVPHGIGLEQAHKLQQRVLLHKIHGGLHALKVLLGHGDFHAQGHGVGLVLHVLVEVVQQALLLDGGQVKQHEEGKQQHDARHRQPDFGLDREAQMPDKLRQVGRGSAVCHGERSRAE